MLKPKKSLGQNFLLDKNIQNKIVNIINIEKTNIIEIGPGLGQLTDKILLKKPNKLILIEKDNDLFKILKEKYKKFPNIIIYNNDVLSINLNFNNDYNLFSNLPYNLSVKIIIKLLTYNDNFLEMIFMIQKDVAEKILNKKNKMNKLSFFINTLSKYNIIFNVSNKVFYPKPKVQSSIIRITPLNTNINKKELWEFSKLIFKNKRKKIKNVIKFKQTNIKIEKLIQNRAEDLTNKNLLFLFKNF